LGFFLNNFSNIENFLSSYMWYNLFDITADRVS
jgi:hypothetical protein